MTEIRVNGKHLIVKHERFEQFEMDLASGRVRALTVRRPRKDIPGAPDGR